MTTTITVDNHAYRVLTPEGWKGYSHKGTCTQENCGRFAEELAGPRRPNRVIDDAIDSMKGKR